MIHKFNSKIGLEIAIPLFVILIGVTSLMFIDTISWLGVMIMLGLIVFVVHLFSTTYYLIKEDKLGIKCGFVFNKVIEIQSITKISESYNAMSSPATSLDRLEIKFNQNDMVLISPKNKKQFIAELKKINPDIEVNYRRVKP